MIGKVLGCAAAVVGGYIVGGAVSGLVTTKIELSKRNMSFEDYGALIKELAVKGVPVTDAEMEAMIKIRRSLKNV